jgi:hypothetical protein
MKWNLAGLRNVGIVAVAVLVAACGGEEAPGDSNAGGNTPTPAPTVTITTTNSATGQPSNALTLSSPLNATATVRDAKGAPVANAIVQFTASASGGSSSSTTAFVTFSPASANGITDANGNVTVVVSAGSVSSSGAGTLSASASVGESSASSSAAIQVAQANIALQNLTLTPATIAAFQTSTITVAVAGVPATTPVSVNFSSVCASAKKATITPTALTVNGTATANYSDSGCGQADTIIVSASGAPSVQGTLTIQPAAATNLVFVSANPDVMGIQGSGANTSSVVTFKVVDAGQQPVANVAVTMALDTVVGGVALENGQATQSKTTAADGTVTTQVVAGTQPTPVRVRASTASGLTAVSSNLTIQSGLPTQARFSLSVETFNIEGWNIDGTKTKVTIRAADRVGNPVPDNTVINFRSSGAALQPSCRTTGGACTVEFVSQANRPLTAPVGRITVLANASGLESFQDSNGNNRYDMGEPFEDLGDAFVDNNFDRVWQAGEDFIPYNAAATAACATGLASTPPPMKPMTCDGVWGGAQVRAQTQIILSGSNARATLPGSINLSPTGPAASECSGGFTALIFDVNDNPMPAGTKIAAEASGVTAKVLNDTVVNTLAPNGTNHGITVTGSTCTGAKTGSVTLKVTTPGGLTTIFPPVIVFY